MNSHSVIILDHSAPVDQRIIIWTPSSTPDSAGIDDVVRLLTEFRGFVRDRRVELNRPVTTLADISNQHVGQLVRMAYRASFETDEGRPIRARIAVPAEARWRTGDETKSGHKQLAQIAVQKAFVEAMTGLMSAVENSRLHSYRFQKSFTLMDHKHIVKLSPLLPQHDGVIAIQEVESELCVTGLGLMDMAEDDGDLYHMPGVWVPSASLTVEIVGPGHLRVAEGAASFELFADRLVTHVGLCQVPQVRNWLAEISRKWVNEILSELGDTNHPFLFLNRKGTDPDDEHPEPDIQIALTRILRRAVSLGHGGAFAVLPDLDLAPINIKYPIIPIDLGAELIETWRAHHKVWNIGRVASSDQIGTAESKRVAVSRWLSRLSSIGQLSAADGCVVFDRRMVLHGFGGSINADLTGLDSGVCHNITTETEVAGEELLRSFGERHKSAFALCRKVPNAIMFVISQDGDLRVFASDREGKLYFASNLRV